MMPAHQYQEQQIYMSNHTVYMVKTLCISILLKHTLPVMVLHLRDILNGALNTIYILRHVAGNKLARFVKIYGKVKPA